MNPLTQFFSSFSFNFFADILDVFAGNASVFKQYVEPDVLCKKISLLPYIVYLGKIRPSFKVI